MPSGSPAPQRRRLIDATVAVVGAGAAGLAAARTLTEAGVTPVILEARARIGGRAHTAMHGGLPLDLGCEWLHSGDRNPWVTLAGPLGLTVDRSPSPWARQSHDIGFGAAEQAAFHAASAALDERVVDQAATGRDMPVAMLLEPGNPWNPLLDAVSGYYNGAEHDAVSVLDYDRYADSGVNWRVREGYGTLVARYGGALPVRLDCPVTLIDHAGPRLRLETPAGTVEADRAIVTVPPSLLTGEGLRFSPDLPGKRAAAAGVPLGVANKVYLDVAEPDAIPAEGHLFGHTDRTETGSYHLRPFGRPIIEGYFGGRFAAAMERDPAAFAAFAVEELVRLLGAEVRRLLTPVAITAWVADPWSRGAYSHALPGHADDRAALAAPVDGRLFFAGEACSRHDFSTAHGALRTGIAAAGAVLASL